MRKHVIGLIAAASTIAACGGGKGSNSSTSPPSAQGSATVMFAAPSSVMSYSTVTLDGTLTRDSTLAISSYAWTQTAGPTVKLTGASTPQATFTAPAVTSETTLTFQLSVTDSKNGVSTYSGNVNVFPASQDNLTPAILAVRFLAPVVDNQHSDAVPVDGPPLAGSSATMEVSLQGAVQTPNFNVVDANGNVLSNAALSPSGSSAVQPLDYVGTVTVPTVSFAVTASGTTADGQKYSLTSSPLTIPATLTVGWTPPSVTLSKGASGSSQLVIYNGGSADTFTVQFQDPSHLLANASNMTTQIGQGQTVTLPVTVTFPNTSASPAARFLTATVSNSGNTQSGSTLLSVWLDGAP